MIASFLRKFYGNFSRDELKKYIIALVIFGCIIGAYWALRPIKDSIFQELVGRSSIPYAKWLSLVVVFPLVIVYSKLLDIFPRQKMLYFLTALYGIGTLIFAYIFADPVLGLQNIQNVLVKGQMESEHALAIGRIIGWCWYVFIESYGSLVVALFWGFMNDITMPESARRGYPLIALGGQIGNIIGPWSGMRLVNAYNSSIPVVVLSAIIMFAVIPLVYIFMNVVPKDLLTGYQSEKTEEKEPGFLEGLKLMLTKPYLLGIFAIITIYEIIVTILDFQFKYLAGGVYKGAALSSYLLNYGMWVGIVSMLCVLLGINNIQRRLGLTASLILLPVIVAFAVVAFGYNPVLHFAFAIMVASKAFNYALNQPTINQLYIPTSKEAKYKAKAWIDMFGSRSSKAIGSGVNIAALNIGRSMFVMASTLSSLSLIAVWFFIVVYLGKTYNKAIKNNELVC